MEEKYHTVRLVNNQSSVEGDSGFREENELMRSSLARWTAPLKIFSWRLLVFILRCRRPPLPARRAGRKREVNAVLMLGFWSGDQSSNRIAYQRHIIHLSAFTSVSETRGKIRVQLAQMHRQEKLQNQAYFTNTAVNYHGYIKKHLLWVVC